MSNNARRTTRILAGVLAGALALSVTPILGFSAAGALDAPTGDGSVCEDVTPATEPFTDVASNDSAINEIICLVATGITKGVTATTYEPTSPVSRRQMALFLVRLADEVAEHAVPGQVTPLPAADGTTPFTDIANESAEVKAAVDRLEAANIAEGVTATTFVPGAFVTRRQMANFIVRLQEFMAGTDITPDNAPNAFTDDNGDSGEPALNVLAAEGVFVGNAAPNAGTVSPGANISRRQMAFVIIRKAQYLFEEGVITRLFPEDDSNATIPVTPAASAENTVSTVAPSANENRGARTYTLSGLTAGTTYDIRLFPCADVTTTNAQVSFADTAANDGEADLNASPAVIESVNGAAIAPSQAAEAVPVNGTITFTIDSTTENVCVVPVIWIDTENDGTLELNAQDRPTETFGVGGVKTWIPAEAAAGVTGSDEVILSVNKTLDRLITADGTFFYDANDTFFIDASFGGACAPEEQVTLAQFEAALSAGDELDDDTVYQPDPALSSLFCIRDDAPAAPAGGAATAVDNDTVNVTFTRVAGIDSYNIYRALDTDQSDQLDDCPAVPAVFPGAPYTLVGTHPGGAAGATTFVDNTASATTEYCYLITAVDDGDESAPAGPFFVETLSGPETTAPLSLDAEITTSGGLGDRLDVGDVIKICFNEAMRAPDANDRIVVEDSDGDISTLTNGGNATFALGAAPTTDVGTALADTDLTTPCPANQTLVVTVTGAVADDNNGTGDGIPEVPTEAEDAAGVTDVAGNSWDPDSGGQDNEFDFTGTEADVE